MAIPKAREPKVKPLRVRLANGAEVAFHGTPAKLAKAHPGSTILRYDDGTDYVPPEPKEPVKDDPKARSKGDGKAASGKGDGKSAETKTDSSAA